MKSIYRRFGPRLSNCRRQGLFRITSSLAPLILLGLAPKLIRVWNRKRSCNKVTRLRCGARTAAVFVREPKENVYYYLSTTRAVTRMFIHGSGSECCKGIQIPRKFGHRSESRKEDPCFGLWDLCLKPRLAQCKAVSDYCNRRPQLISETLLSKMAGRGARCDEEMQHLALRPGTLRLGQGGLAVTGTQMATLGPLRSARG